MNLSALNGRALGSAELFLKKHGATILTGVGVAGFAATTVLVGRAVLKSQDKVTKLKSEVNWVRIKEVDENYTEVDKSKEAGRVWLRNALDVSKEFVPPLVVGSASIFCVLAAHGIMKRQQAALAAAYVALDNGFRAYRNRIREEFGEDRELEFYRGVRKIPSVGEDGEACEIIDYNDTIPSPYARFFDETSPNWSKTPEYNLMFLRAQQEYANHRLQSRGYLFLNEVLEALGLPWSQMGQMVGWKLDSENGDGFVDFGIYDIADECNRAFVNGVEHTVLLDFNVDGPIRI